VTIIRRAPYNREVIVVDRWRIPYAPAYGWPEYVRGIYKAVVRTDPAYSDNALGVLIEQSSLGTPAAKAIRARTPPEVARVVAIASARIGEVEDERDRLRAAAMGTTVDLRVATDLLRDVWEHDIADLTAASYRALREALEPERPTGD